MNFISVPASIAVVPNDASLYVGETASLSCLSYGLPLPTISWDRDGQPLPSSLLLNESETSVGHVTFVRSTLVLCSLKLLDGGQYVCSSSNNHSTTQHTFTITMKSMRNLTQFLFIIFLFFSVEPQVVIFPNNSNFFAGSTVSFSCAVFGLPLPFIRWSRNSSELTTTVFNDSRIDIHEKTVVVGGHTFVHSTLQICSAVEVDGGRYSCSAVTREREERADFEVNVIRVPPALINTPGKTRHVCA